MYTKQQSREILHELLIENIKFFKVITKLDKYTLEDPANLISNYKKLYSGMYASINDLRLLADFQDELPDYKDLTVKVFTAASVHAANLELNFNYPGLDGLDIEISYKGQSISKVSFPIHTMDSMNGVTACLQSLYPILLNNSMNEEISLEKLVEKPELFYKSFDTGLDQAIIQMRIFKENYPAFYDKLIKAIEVPNLEEMEEQKADQDKYENTLSKK